MAGREKDITEMLGDIKKGDQVRFVARLSTQIPDELGTHVRYAKGYCLSDTSQDDPRGTWHNFSETEGGKSSFRVCPTNRNHQLKAPGDGFRSIDHYRIISRAKAPSTQSQRTMLYIGLTYL